MSEQPQPEDPIWSKWRAREHPVDEPVGAERISFGDPLDPNWAEGPRDHRPPPPPEPDPAPEPAEHPRGEHECLEFCPICRTADIVRATVPPKLRSQFEVVQRDALVAIRAALDHYIDRLDGRSRPESRVEDIPIR
jgi:hypothetical protein